MDTRLQRLAAEMLMRYAVKGESDIAVIPYTPQKTESFSSRVSQRFFRVPLRRKRGSLPAPSNA